MIERNDLIGYEPQGWPIFKMNLEEILIALGGEIIDDKIIFKKTSDFSKIYPVVLTDDGMGYGVDPNYITEIDSYKSDGITHINIFRESKPSKEEQEDLFKRWDEEMKSLYKSQ